MYYYCENCGSKFEELEQSFEPYPDWGGEYVDICPICRVPDYFVEVLEEGDEGYEYDEEGEDEED